MLKMENRVSVVMPTYNGSKFIKRAIESILVQTHTNFEFLIIDDGSIDNTSEVINSFKDDRINYIFQKNSGPSSAYNMGFKCASTDFIFIMDHDDYSYPRRLETQLNYISINGLDICGSFFEIIEQQRGYIEKKTLPIHFDEIKREILFRPWTLFNPTLCIRKSVFSNFGFFNEKLIAGYDYDFMLRVAFDVKCSNVPEFLYQWTQHKKSHGWQSQSKGNKHYQNIAIKKINSDSVQIAADEKLFFEGMVYYYADSFLRAAVCFIKSMISVKFERKALLYFILSTALSPLVILFRRQQLFSHPRIVIFKSFFNGSR